MVSRAAFIGVFLLVVALSACSSDSETPANVETGSGPTDTPVPLAETDLQTPAHAVEPDERVQFESDLLEWEGEQLLEPTTLAFGPDGRLYVGQLNGRIVALTFDGEDVTAVDVIAEEDVFDSVLGIAFNPNDPATTLYVSHSLLYAGAEGPPFANGISKLTAPDFVPEDVITGLPSSAVEHGTNGIAFDNQGRLFIAQGGSTNAGIPSERFARAETPLSGAVLVAEPSAPGFDGAIRYEPEAEASDTTVQVAGDIRVFAAGFRNPYDIVVHSNGYVYATDNGPNGPDGLQSSGCATEDEGPTHADELNLIVDGGYYGHPNRNRGQTDERQCAYHAPDEDVAGLTNPITTLGYFVSADGFIEYKGDAFGGLLNGNLIYVEWAQGRVWRIVLSADGLGVDAISQLFPERLQRPLDIAEAPDGALYIAEMGADRIRVLSPRT